MGERGDGRGARRAFLVGFAVTVTVRVVLFIIFAAVGKADTPFVGSVGLLVSVATLGLGIAAGAGYLRKRRRNLGLRPDGTQYRSLDELPAAGTMSRQAQDDVSRIIESAMKAAQARFSKTGELVPFKMGISDAGNMCMSSQFGGRDAPLDSGGSALRCTAMIAADASSAEAGMIVVTVQHAEGSSIKANARYSWERHRSKKHLVVDSSQIVATPRIH